MTRDREAREELADVLMRMMYTYSPRDDYETETLRLARMALDKYGPIAMAKEQLSDVGI